MRIDSSVTSVSWIPSEAATGLPKAGFTLGLARCDDPPPDHIEDLGELHDAERFRFANRLAAWLEVDGDRVVDSGYSGRGFITCTRMRLGSKTEVVFQPAEFPELRSAPEVTDSEVRFVQTTGGRTGAPLPRPVHGKPFFQWVAPTVWTTLSLTIRADGSSRHEVLGASRFPRHWIYDHEGRLVEKSGVTESHEWLVADFGVHSPWGDEDSKPLVAVAESALERQLSSEIMRGGMKPSIRRLAKGSVLTKQGEPGRELYLLLDGILEVTVDGSKVGELGPGAIAGERSVLGEGHRTATLAAITDCVVAAAPEGQIDRDKLAGLAEGHHREDLSE